MVLKKNIYQKGNNVFINVITFFDLENVKHIICESFSDNLTLKPAKLPTYSKWYKL
jgi:hypothetical protein